MYKSVKQDDKFLVVVHDGIFSHTLMELPTEILADKVAFELQSAWQEGEDYGARKKWEKLDPKSYWSETTKYIRKYKIMSDEEKEVYRERMERRKVREDKVREARIWRSVLAWKRFEYGGDGEINLFTK